MRYVIKFMRSAESNPLFKGFNKSNHRLHYRHISSKQEQWNFEKNVQFTQNQDLIQHYSKIKLSFAVMFTAAHAPSPSAMHAPATRTPSRLCSPPPPCLASGRYRPTGMLTCS